MLDKIIALVAPPDEDASQRRIFYWRLSMSAFVLLLLFHISHILGWVKGLDGVAFANGVDQQIEEAVKPITERLSAIEIEQNSQGGLLRTLVKSDFVRLINRELLAKCEATTRHDRERISSAIESYQTDYEVIFGERYEEPRCEDL